DVVFGDEVAVAVAEDGFEEDADAEGQFAHRAEALLFEAVKAVDAGGTAAGVKGFAGLEGVEEVGSGHERSAGQENSGRKTQILAERLGSVCGMWAARAAQLTA